jgi:hypothetical protein
MLWGGEAEGVLEGAWVVWRAGVPVWPNRTPETTLPPNPGVTFCQLAPEDSSRRYRITSTAE